MHRTIEGTVTISVKDFEWLNQRSEEFDRYRQELERQVKRVCGIPDLKQLDEKYREVSAIDAHHELRKMATRGFT